jgi:hypothetical protein
MLQEKKKSGRQNLSSPALPKGTRERGIHISCCRSPGTALLDSEFALTNSLQLLKGPDGCHSSVLGMCCHIRTTSAALKASEDRARTVCRAEQACSWTVVGPHSVKGVPFRFRPTTLSLRRRRRIMWLLNCPIACRASRAADVVLSRRISGTSIFAG